MAPNKKKKSEPKVVIPDPIVAPIIHQLYLQEVYNRTELERQAAMIRVRAELSIPNEMVYNPQAGAFLIPPTAPTGPELLPDTGD